MACLKAFGQYLKDLGSPVVDLPCNEVKIYVVSVYICSRLLFTFPTQSPDLYPIPQSHAAENGEFGEREDPRGIL